MELFFEQIEEAKKALKIADHLTYVTFPLIGDEKIMIMIADNLNISLNKALEAILNYDKCYKRISNVPEDFENRLDIFKSEVSKRYNISNETTFMIKELKEIIDAKKKQSSGLLKKDNLFLFSNDYKFKTLNLKKIKEYINMAKLFINKVNTIIGNNARRF